MPNILVTGGAGFIGSNFVLHRLATPTGDRLVVLDDLTYAGNRNNLQAVQEDPALRFVKGSINDRALIDELLREEDIDTIIHFAAESHVDRSIHGPDVFITTNIVGTHTLLASAREFWLQERGQRDSHWFQHVSTDEVYGSLGVNDSAFSETTAFSPNSPYAASKAASDHLVRAYNKTYHLNTCISNCSNNYGPFQFPEKLIPLMLINILHDKALPIYGDGKNIRDWLHVEDHCRALDRLLEQGRAGETYNVGGENEIDNRSLVNLLCRLVDERFANDTTLTQTFPNAAPAKGKKSASLINYTKDREGHDCRYAINPAKINNELGFHLLHDFDSGLEATVDWYLANRNWWEQVLDGRYRAWIEKQY